LERDYALENPPGSERSAGWLFMKEMDVEMAKLKEGTEAKSGYATEKRSQK
jgi:hypothetical protein